MQGFGLLFAQARFRRFGLELLDVVLAGNHLLEHAVDAHRVTDVGDLAVAVDEERARDAVLLGGRHEGFVGRAILVPTDGVAHRVALVRDHLLDLLERVAARVLRGDADDGEALVAVLLLQLADVRHRGDARTTPRGPELDHVDLALLELLDRRTLDPLLDVEGRRGIAHA